MNSSVSPSPTDSAPRPESIALSSARVTVVPTAITRPPALAGLRVGVGQRGGDRVALLEHPVLGDILRSHRQERSGPDLEREEGEPHPARARRPSKVRGLKWSPAVGAATAPGSRAKTVW